MHVSWRTGLAALVAIEVSVMIATAGVAMAQTTAADEGQTMRSGAQIAATSCAACHGVDGNSTESSFPKLAGQKPDYLRMQIEAFRSGARKSDVMSGQVTALTEAQISDLANYYSAQQTAPDKLQDDALARAGGRIFRGRRRGVPSCAACHGGGVGAGGMMGRGGMGMRITNPAITPRLDGQHSAYIRQQLDAFASGARSSDIMGPIAASLRPRDRAAVAEYLSGLN